MTGRHWFVASIATVVVATAVGAAASTLGHDLDGPVNVPFVLVTLALGAAFAAVGGLLVAVRAGNVLGPLLCVSGTALVAEMTLREVVYDALDGGAPQDWEQILAWTSGWLDVLGLPLPLVLILLLFPDGHLPSARWRPVVALAAAVGAIRLALFVLGPGPVRLDSHDLSVPWSGVVDLDPATYDRIESATGGTVILLLLAAAASLLIRFWAGNPDTRQRLTPLGLAVATMVLGIVLQSVPGFAAAGVVVFVIGGACVPVALTVGALRHRVWDLDPLLVKAIAYAGLAVLVTVLYVAVVQGLVLVLGVRYDDDGLLPSVAATVVVAAVFSPARQRLERAARRLVFGERADPYATLAALPQRLVDAPAADEVLPATAADHCARSRGRSRRCQRPVGWGWLTVRVVSATPGRKRPRRVGGGTPPGRARRRAVRRPRSRPAADPRRPPAARRSRRPVRAGAAGRRPVGRAHGAAGPDHGAVRGAGRVPAAHRRRPEPGAQASAA